MWTNGHHLSILLWDKGLNTTNQTIISLVLWFPRWRTFVSDKGKITAAIHDHVSQTHWTLLSSPTMAVQHMVWLSLAKQECVCKVGKCLKIIYTYMYIAKGHFFWGQIFIHNYYITFSKQFGYCEDDKSDNFLRDKSNNINTPSRVKNRANDVT